MSRCVLGQSSCVTASRAPFELILLGTQAGPPLERGRYGIASALVVDGATYVIDCGRGAATQYLRAGLPLKSMDSIFLTHLHADHLMDYYNFFLGGGHIPNTDGDTLPGPISVYGPGSAGDLPERSGGQAPEINSDDPTPGTAAMTESLHKAFAYSTNVFLRDMHIRDIRELTDVGGGLRAHCAEDGAVHQVCCGSPPSGGGEESASTFLSALSVTVHQ